MDERYKINTSTYDWTLKSFSLVKKILKVNIKLHDEPNDVEQGDIFLFNHFARFETFIPQYLFHRDYHVYCRSVAAAEFFSGNENFAKFLRSIGAVPNNHDRLIPFLAKEILHGRKVVMFPEGGMVKDKKVMDKKGRFKLYSRTAHTHRKQHTGAAVLALAVDTFKTAVIYDYTMGNMDSLKKWAQELEFESVEQLIIKAIKPTKIVPCNITFYPIRIDENILLNSVDLLSKGINKRFVEELTIEGNILFKNTDMDIRIGRPIEIRQFWKWWERLLLPNVAHRYNSLDELFNLESQKGHWRGKIHSLGMRQKVSQVRDFYMEKMYQVVTVHLSHLASTIIMILVEQKTSKILKSEFHHILYLAVKYCQKEKDIFLHRSLQNPEEYGLVIEGKTKRLQQFIDTASKSDLITYDDSYYCFSDKLSGDYQFDEIRIRNFISVYANEVRPLKAVCNTVKKALINAPKKSAKDFAKKRYNDQLIAYDYDLKKYNQSKYDEINNQETRVEKGNWFFLKHKQEATGVLLTHGFLASPAELKSLADVLYQQGFNVLGVRLKGHGTSPEDLKRRKWSDWYQSIERGYKILNAFSENIHLIGFSTGGSLSLLFAANNPAKAKSVIAVSSLLKFQNNHILFTPFIHQANKLMKSLSLSDGIKTYVTNHSEHPKINYKNTPITALNQLNKMVDVFYDALPKVQCKVDLFQGDEDPIVNPKSAQLILDKLPDIDKKLHIIHSKRHGLINEDIDAIHTKIVTLLSE